MPSAAAIARRAAEARWERMTEEERAADRARREASRPSGRLRSSLMKLAREELKRA